MGAQLGDQGLERRVVAELRIEAVEVDDVVAVGRAGARHGQRRGVHMTYAERGEIRHDPARIVEPEVLVELQPVSRARHDRVGAMANPGNCRPAAAIASAIRPTMGASANRSRSRPSLRRQLGCSSRAGQVRLLLLAERVLQLHHEQVPRRPGEVAVHGEDQLVGGLRPAAGRDRCPAGSRPARRSAWSSRIAVPVTRGMRAPGGVLVREAREAIAPFQVAGGPEAAQRRQIVGRHRDQGLAWVGFGRQEGAVLARARNRAPDRTASRRAASRVGSRAARCRDLRRSPGSDDAPTPAR